MQSVISHCTPSGPSPICLSLFPKGVSGFTLVWVCVRVCKGVFIVLYYPCQQLNFMFMVSQICESIVHFWICVLESPLPYFLISILQFKNKDTWQNLNMWNVYIASSRQIYEKVFIQCKFISYCFAGKN